MQHADDLPDPIGPIIPRYLATLAWKARAVGSALYGMIDWTLSAILLQRLVDVVDLAVRLAAPLSVTGPTAAVHRIAFGRLGDFAGR